jgi:hypothetical protein
MQEQSGNPALSKKVLQRVMSVDSVEHATVPGTIARTIFLLILLTVAGAFTWRAVNVGSTSIAPLLIISIVSALGLGLIASFFPKSTPITAPLYAIAEGVLLGAVSKMFSEQYNNIIIQAVALTGVIFFSALFLYSTRIIKITQKFQSIVLIATGGIFLYYLLTIILSFFHFQMPLIYNTGPFGIIFSLVVIFVAALNLFLDFNLVETAANNKAPKVFEWYGAFALMVTIVWLYLEILRLLSKIRN